MKKIGLLAAFAIITIFFCGCSKTQQQLVDSWLTKDGKRLELFSDGSWVDGQDNYGDYSVDGNRLKLTSFTDVEIYTFELSGNRLTLYSDSPSSDSGEYYRIITDGKAPDLPCDTSIAEQDLYKGSDNIEASVVDFSKGNDNNYRTIFLLTAVTEYPYMTETKKFNSVYYYNYAAQEWWLETQQEIFELEEWHINGNWYGYSSNYQGYPIELDYTVHSFDGTMLDVSYYQYVGFVDSTSNGRGTYDVTHGRASYKSDGYDVRVSLATNGKASVELKIDRYNGVCGLKYGSIPMEFTPSE